MSEQYVADTLLVRILKIILKSLIFVLCLFICTIIGLFIGYCVIGDGNVWEVLNRQTWQHIFDFIR